MEDSVDLMVQDNKMREGGGKRRNIFDEVGETIIYSSLDNTQIIGMCNLRYSGKVYSPSRNNVAINSFDTEHRCLGVTH